MSSKRERSKTNEEKKEKKLCLQKNTIKRKDGEGSGKKIIDSDDEEDIKKFSICTTSNIQWPRPVPTHINDLDYLLDGGLPVMHITELCGLPDAGKTQFAYKIAANISRIDKRNVIYIDTKGDFSARRIQQILSHNCKNDLDVDLSLERIKAVNISEMNQLINFLHDLKNDPKMMDKVSLIIIDSLPALMLQHQGQKFKHSLGSLNQFVNVARYLGYKYKVAFVVVNLFTRWVDGATLGETTDSSNFSQSVQPTLGKYWQFIPYIRLDVVKEKLDSSNIKIKIHTRNYDNLSNMTLSARIENEGVVIAD